MFNNGFLWKERFSSNPGWSDLGMAEALSRTRRLFLQDAALGWGKKKTGRDKYPTL
jgi:hypothetical protein